MKKRIRPSKGVTLYELVIVILIFGIVATAFSNLIAECFNSFFAGKNILTANWQANIALEKMVRDLHAVRSKTDIATATSNSLTFTDLNGNSITYQVSNNQLMRNSQVLATNIKAISFNYYTSSTSPSSLTTPVTSIYLTTIRYVVITLTVLCDNVTYTSTTAAHLWALK